MSDPIRSLSIGQVIYVLSNVKQKIVPAVVVEEIVVKKLDGNQVSWKVSVGPPGKERIVDSNRLDGDIYSSLEEIRDILYKRLSGFLDGLISEAERRVESWYGQQVSVSRLEHDSAHSNSSDSQSKIAPENLISEFESHALSNTAHGQPVQQVRQQQNITIPQRSSDEARNELRRRLDPESDKLQEGSDNPNVLETEEIQLPDGRKVRLNLRG